MDLRNIDCMDLMKEFEDNHFDLAICDPPYGLRIAENGKLHNHSKFDRGFNGTAEYKPTSWDDAIPNAEYFAELKRVSKVQIVFGGNFFFEHLGNSRTFIIWDKRGNDKTPNFSPCELAWTNANGLPKIYDVAWLGFGYLNNSRGQEKIHPTEKPIDLYRRILRDYAKQGMKVLDTHLGSGSIAIACYEEGIDLTGSEINTDYFNAMNKRIKDETAQTSLFSI